MRHSFCDVSHVIDIATQFSFLNPYDAKRQTQKSIIKKLQIILFYSFFQTKLALLTNLLAITETASKRNGYVTTKTIVEMAVMNANVPKTSAT